MKKLFLLSLFAVYIQTANIIAQTCTIPWCTTGNNIISSTNYLGADLTSSVPLAVKTRTNFPIQFYTNDTLRCIIDSTTGYVAIGTNFTNPKFQLDVKSGININTPDTFYCIDGKRVLHNKGFENIFCGVGAGSAIDLVKGKGNVFMGYRAGYVNDSGFDCTFIGFEAGLANKKAEHNTFIGDATGHRHVSGNYNVFLGAHAGSSDTLGSSNTFVGYSSGGADSSGSLNSFFGYLSRSGGPSATHLYNSSAIGANAVVEDSNAMILGDNAVYVGIGLSGVPGGPQTKLEVRSGGTQLRLSNNYDTTYTDFQTTALGDLYIHPDSGSTDRRVGINTSLPNYTLEVNGTIGAKNIYIVSENGSAQNVLTLITQLQQEVNELKQLLVAKN